MSDDGFHDQPGDLPSPGASWRADRPGSARLPDIKTYRMLVRLGRTLHHLPARC